jgi:prolyl-tRNA synthetase
LLGIPVRLTISAKTLEQESIELKKRSEKETKLIKISELEKIFK